MKAYLADTYGAWESQHRKTGDEIITRITPAFPAWQAWPLDQLTTFAVEKWRTERRRANLAPATINRDLSALRGALTQAVRRKIIKTHRFGDLEPLKVDARPKVPYLTPPISIGKLTVWGTGIDYVALIARALAWRPTRGKG